MKELMMDWLVAKEAEKEWADKRLAIEIELYKKAAESNTIMREGPTKVEDDGVKLTITSSLDYKVDQELAAAHPELFKVKYEYSKTVLKTLSEEQIKPLADMITVKPKKPSFKVEVL